MERPGRCPAQTLRRVNAVELLPSLSNPFLESLDLMPHIGGSVRRHQLCLVTKIVSSWILMDGRNLSARPRLDWSHQLLVRNSRSSAAKLDTAAGGAGHHISQCKLCKTILHGSSVSLQHVIHHADARCQCWKECSSITQPSPKMRTDQGLTWVKVLANFGTSRHHLTPRNIHGIYTSSSEQP